ncbi:L-seryl-tRNA(Sec) kinase, putative [Plasmodium gallinaceum]|uniref:L-seryl-tRNA(Sec) kinase, putative n=1 Tax=Plasmodium gallinaceum TaxID=5849 RepID=A0A1J1GLT9_PLAGA|nr:L-seryl-tRNA(Sec) kinase, putative [Plasmodium gallinaceum]CRG93291.1 L-seryl-tRNA(Sec) kinase, putative [Plasmodium gallinaceum]
MNCILLFYGNPCSGKDTFINFLLKKKKKILLFLYFFVNLTKDNSHKYIKEKIFFVKLIKYFYKINNFRYKLVYKEKNELRISFNFLIYLIRHFSIIIKNKYFYSYKYMKLIHLKKKKNFKNNNKYEKYTIKKWRIKKRQKLFNYFKNSKIFFVFYKEIVKWKIYFKKFLEKNKFCIYNISTDFIEKQFYHNLEKDTFKFNITNRKYIYTLNKKYIIFSKKINNSYYLFIKKTNIKNEQFVINKKKKKKKVTLINQSKNWKTARTIAYEYCMNLMKINNKNYIKDNKKKKNNYCNEKLESKIIILNDTFHFPSMRKQYYILSKKYYYNYIQIFMNTPLKTCLSRNKNRKKFKYISDKTIIKNHKYHRKYAIRLKEYKCKNLLKTINVIKGNYKWQMKILSLEVNSFKKKKFLEVLFFIYKYSNYFKDTKEKKLISIKEQHKPKIELNYLDIVNLTINKIIHEKLKELPNDQKNEYAKKFRLIKLQLLKECKTGKTYNIKNIENKFIIN